MARQRLKIGRWITAALALAVFAPMCLAAGPFALPARAQSLEGVGVVLIHGKRGGQGPLRPLAAALKAEGALVLLPRMSWARSGYRTYQETLGEIADAVAQARALGARKVYLAGHSLGANVSIGYSASGGAIDGVVAMGPGHRPGVILRRIGDSLARAQAMIREGRGGEVATFEDYKSGRTDPDSHERARLCELLRSRRSGWTRVPRARRAGARPVGHRSRRQRRHAQPGAPH